VIVHRPAFVAALFAALSLAHAASAQEAAPAPAATPAPDKSGFTFLNPTPDADLRSLCTDRPTKSTSPCTVDAGHFQFESDLFNVTVDRSGGATTTTWLATNPTLKLGLANTLDVELNIVPVEIVTVRDHLTGQETRQSGVGDLFARLKWSLLGDDGGAVGFALVPYIKAPTAPTGIGNGAVEEGLIAPLSVNLPMSFQLVVDPEIDILKNAGDSGRHINTSGLISLGRPVTKEITLSAELWSDVNFDPLGRTTQYSADFGAAWIPAKHQNFQLDGGVNLGLDHQTPGVQGYIGVSRRF
jgi:Putative MetA-pathway of phenol degradation